ncbi:hypothetical protein [Lacinutrix jangbogonensis]|uniref:hypothetical protein n=1 Tax=Lacinutrix jangbogonensis TaxID=1469557 RepID=UPI00053E3FF0|nr:hypothetical protein [Lacinutrix jangbogonensis]
MELKEALEFPEHFWKDVLDNNPKTEELLVDISTAITKKEEKATALIDFIFNQINTASNGVVTELKNTSFYKDIADVKIDLYSIYTNYKNLDEYSVTPIIELLHSIKDAILVVLNALIKNSSSLQWLEKEVENWFTFAETILSDTSKTLKQNLTALQTRVFELIKHLPGITENQKEAIKNTLNSVVNVTDTVHKIEETVEDTTAYFAALKENAPDIEQELKNIKIPKGFSFGAITLDSVLQDLENLYTETTTFNLYKTKEILTFIKDKIIAFLEYIGTISFKGVNLSEQLKNAKKHITSWLTLDSNEFNGILDVLKHILEQIVYSFKGVIDTAGDLAKKIYHQMRQLLHQLEKLKDSGVTFSVKDKVSTSKNRDHLYSEETYEPKETLKAQAIADKKTAPKLKETTPEDKQENKKSNNTTDANHHSFTKIVKQEIDKVIATFTEDNNALAKDWQKMANLLFKGHLRENVLTDIEDIISNLIDIDAIETGVENFKEQFLQKGKLQLGALLDYVVETFVAFIKKMIKIFKALVDYFIKQVSDFLQLNIEIIQKLEIPTAHLPIFLKRIIGENNHKNILVYLLAIPYTALEKLNNTALPTLKTI